MEHNEYTIVKSPEYYYDTYADGQVLYHIKKNRLPAMGWNSWNAFGSGNTEYLTKEMAAAFQRLGLKELGHEYLILDDGCYKPERVEGRLSNDTVKFPSGFRALADHIHSLGLKFGMYNDIGTNLWDNATFSAPENARYVYTPNLRKMVLIGENFRQTFDAVDCELTGTCAVMHENYVNHIGTFDGTGPDHIPMGEQASELLLFVDASAAGNYHLTVTYASGKEEGIGQWLQVAVEEQMFFDDLLPETAGPEDYLDSAPINITLKEGANRIRIMNHRRQENTLGSYGTFQKALFTLAPDNEMMLSICEWGKTQPHNWGYKVGDSWRILNDITFQVGADGEPGGAAWSGDYTNNLTAQYNKCVIMDAFAGLSRGWIR